MSGEDRCTRRGAKKILNVHHFIKMLTEKDDLTVDSFKNPLAITAEPCYISARTGRRLCIKDKTSSEAIEKGLSSELDDFDRDLVRRTIFEFYEKGEYPTPRSLLNKIKKRLPNYDGSLLSVIKLLRSLKIFYKKCRDGRAVLREPKPILFYRCTFLFKMWTLRRRNDTRPVVYLDEIWVNQHQSGSLLWKTNAETESLKKPTDNGSFLIITHAGSSRYGFIKGFKLVFECQDSGSTDYRMSVHADSFREWFTDLARRLPEPCIIVMDNAPYHSFCLDDYPTTTTPLADAREWLKNHGVVLPDESLAELVHRQVELLKPSYKRNEFDRIARSMGHMVMRLPRHHCNYNPIEIVSELVKGEVAKKNKTFKLEDVDRLALEALDSVSRSDWEKCVERAEAIQDEDYKKLFRDRMRRRPEPIILTLDSDDSDYSSADSDEECGTFFF